MQRNLPFQLYKLRTRWMAVLFAMLFLPSFKVQAQPDKILLDLPVDASSLLRQHQFYIQDVEDKRKTPGASLGRLIVFGKETPVVLPRSADKLLFDYWSFQAPKKDQTYLPLYVTVRDLQLNEKRIGPNKVQGEVKLSVSFRWYRSMQPVELTGYQTSANYTRPERDYDHAKLVKQLLDQSLIHFNTWMQANVGKNAVLARNVILVFKELTGSNAGDTVFYSPKRPLVWDDFRGKNARPGTRYAAAVFTSFSYEGKSYPKGPDLVLEIGLKTFMIKSMSWAFENAKNQGTIRHEQLHFDVTRTIVERFKDRLKKAELTVEDFDSEVQYQFLEAFREMNNEQERYDGETGHGLNTAAQQSWDRKISEEIANIYSTQ